MTFDHFTRRRRILKAGACAGALFLPAPYALLWAQQSDGALKLVRVPKIGLVIGNSKYVESPLRNPGNDAQGIAAQLKALGFEVTLKLDAGRNDMLAAIRSFGAELAKKQGVGLFYYAGHGAQLAWKNYLIPVDAVIDKLEDMEAKTVELNALLDGLVKAKNPMNVIILDACRDNPFGAKVRSQQKGLSQFDAPPGSLLAYATSPGNTAADGEGANGLFTENLLREIKVPEARIEDVFKRVRLAVRRKTEGQQIPWESTSLEEDFWFIPPKEVKRLSEAEAERLFKEELALWERIKEAKDPKPLEGYLRRYPSGNFSELAQLRLERVLAAEGEKKIQIASAAGNPFTKGSAFTRIANVGDTYTYRVFGLMTKTEQPNRTVTVTRVTDTEVIHDNGLVTDLLGNQLRSRQGSVFSPNQFVPQEFAVGKRWSTRYDVMNSKGVRYYADQEFRIVAREMVKVLAGTFNAFLIDGRGRNTNPEGPVDFTVRRWYVPEFQRPVVREEIDRRDNKVIFSERIELMSYKLA